MKNLGKLKLKLNKISKNEMVHLKGGDDIGGVCVTPTCSCACAYSGSGGSSTDYNCSSNSASGLHS